MPLRALEPKSSASASSATLARGGYFALYRLFRVGSHAPRSLSRQGRHKARSFAATTTCRRFQPIAGPLHIGPWHSGSFDVQPVMSFAIRCEQFAVRPDDLLEYWNPESAPQLLAFANRQRRIAGGFEHNDRMSEYRRTVQRRKPQQLLVIRGHRGRCECGHFFRPTMREHANRVFGRKACLPETGR